MKKLNLKKNSKFIYVFLAVFTAAVFRQIGFLVNEMFDQFLIILRASIYIGLFATWGISVRDRIIQPQVRRYLTAVSALMVFWITVRTIRYSLEECLWVIRHLWYLYYLPMLFIPLLAMFIALSLGKPEGFRLPKWVRLLYIPTVTLLLMVLTNDLHQFVFVFPADAVVWGNDYSYAAGYFMAVGWMIFCTVTALVTMLIKCRIPYSRAVLMLPFIPAMAALIYAVCLFFRLPWLIAIAGDMTVVFCLFIAAILESCIACSLIQSNTGYEELFMVSRLGAQITNQENTVCLSSSNARELTEEQRMSARVQPVLADQTTLVRSQPIQFGHVLWQVDIAGITEAIEQIEENCRDLAESNRIRQKNLETRKKILALQEKNRISDMLHRETARQIDLISRMLSQYDTETDDRKCRRLLAGAAVAGAYIKRYGNLLLIGERTETVDIRDLSRCFDESFVNLELLGVNCLHILPSGISLVMKDVLKVYSSFETAVWNLSVTLIFLIWRQWRMRFPSRMEYTVFRSNCRKAVKKMNVRKITERLKDKRELRAAIKEALDTLPSAVCYFTSAGTVKLCNAAMNELFRKITQCDLQSHAELKEALESCDKINGIIRDGNVFFFRMGRHGSILRMKLQLLTVRFIRRRCSVM